MLRSIARNPTNTPLLSLAPPPALAASPSFPSHDDAPAQRPSPPPLTPARPPASLIRSAGAHRVRVLEAGVFIRRSARYLMATFPWYRSFPVVVAGILIGLFAIATIPDVAERAFDSSMQYVTDCLGGVFAFIKFYSMSKNNQHYYLIEVCTVAERLISDPRAARVCTMIRANGEGGSWMPSAITKLAFVFAGAAMFILATILLDRLSAAPASHPPSPHRKKIS